MKKTSLILALTSVMASNPSSAAIIDMTYNGLYTFVDPAGSPLQNTSYPYYGDTTWGYGFRTQITGTLQYDTKTGLGSATINPFELLSPPSPPEYVVTNFKLKNIGGGLILGNMDALWNSNNMVDQIVLDASGLFAGIASISTGDVFDSNSCAASGACATPASDGMRSGKYPVGPVPIATSSFNTAGQTGAGTTVGQLSLGTDDGIAGSPFDNGPFVGLSTSIDFTSLTVTKVSTVPVPAAVWLFGTGLLSLLGVARRRKALSQC